jgi:hypothetical protein
MLGWFHCVPHDGYLAFQLFIALMIGHALADFPLQGEYLASCKNRRWLLKLNDPNRPSSHWWICMSMHCFIQAGMVWIITQSFVLGMIEWLLHFCIDCIKCNRSTSLFADQLAHSLCKVGYVIVFYLGYCR